MNYTDLQLAPDGRAYVLSDEGQIFGQQNIDVLRYQGIPEAKRPAAEFVSIAGPPDGVVKKIAFNPTGSLFALTDTGLWERIVDPGNLFSITHKWRAVALPQPVPEEVRVPEKLVHAWRANGAGSEEYVLLQDGNYRVQANSTVAIERRLSSTTWRQVELKESRFNTQAGTIRVHCGPDSVGEIQIWKVS